jgi:uncharacterized protein YgbK (DUF1537 family)
MSEPLFSFYGDDFTGSTDALEALAANGLPSVLFPQPPDERLLAAFPGCRALGIAGESRSRGPEWMSANLPAVFETLKSYGAPVCQYKVCSTFDSSPETGSIGRALEIGQAVFDTPWVPIAVAAPHLQRHVLFGNLFAAGGGMIHRIDRHPTMSRHPVTTMEESDLRLHLARQTDRPIALLDILALQSPDPEAALARLVSETSVRAIIFDGLDESSLEITGRLLWNSRPKPQTFAIGSSGLTHSLIRYWRRAGIIPTEFKPPSAAAVDRLVVISGSCSPVTEGQIRWAAANGFEGLRVQGTREALLDCATSILSDGRSVVLYTALGPPDCGGNLRGEPLGSYLGELLRDLVQRTGVRRVVLAGGDTSTHAVRQLGVDALTFAALTTPGAPLCRCHSATDAVDGLEIVLKGGQVGPEDYFAMVRRGNS